MAEKAKLRNGGKVNLRNKRTSYKQPLMGKAVKVKKDKNRVWIRERIKTPFPTNYLPTIPLKISAILRYYEFKKLIKTAEREQRKERDIQSSKYSILVTYLEEEIDKEREKLLNKNTKADSILLFKIHPKFDGVLGKVIKYLSIQDEVKVITMNANYDKVAPECPRLLLVKVSVN